MKANYDFSKGSRNPYAKHISEHGLTVVLQHKDKEPEVRRFSPKEIESMDCGVESKIPSDIRKRVYQAVMQDKKNSDAGGVFAGAFIRLIGVDGAESLYEKNPERYVRELSYVEGIIASEKTIAMLADNIPIDALVPHTTSIAT